MPNCVTLWIGEALGPIERACLRSVLRHNQRLTLYCYQVPTGVPDGVEVADAAAILPESAILRHRGGSVAPFSDWFRYELLRRGLGTWVDTDMYMIRPLDRTSAYLFGRERPEVINNAVLRVPADSPVLGEMLKPFNRTTPSWLAPRHRWKSRLREWIRGNADIGAMPWGTTGPAALTAAAKKFGLDAHAVSAGVFYPVPWERAAWILDDKVRLEDVCTEQTVGVHLWNECIKAVKDGPAPPGSFLGRLQSEAA